MLLKKPHTEELISCLEVGLRHADKGILKCIKTIRSLCRVLWCFWCFSCDVMFFDVVLCLFMFLFFCSFPNVFHVLLTRTWIWDCTQPADGIRNTNVKKDLIMLSGDSWSRTMLVPGYSRCHSWSFQGICTTCMLRIGVISYKRAEYQKMKKHKQPSKIGESCAPKNSF